MNEETERYFPNHRLQRDIGLAEYQMTAAKLDNDDKALTWATNAAIFVSTAVSFFAFRVSDFLKGLDADKIDASYISTVIIIALLLFSFLACLHLANMLKSRVFSERKIVVIRRMLGVEYGDTSLVLPKWRLEGADNPFVIRLFPGFFSYRCASIHIVLAAVSLGVILLWDTSLLSRLSDRQTFVEEPKIPIAFAITWYAILLLVFRYQLREQNENAWLFIGRFVSWAFRLPLARNFEDNLYNVRLSIAEAHRLEADFQALENLAVAIEDKSFWKHRGLNYRGLARAAIGRLQGKSAGGGSSITQQFVRTNFIYDLSPPLRRKLVESILAKWAESALTKQEILHGYLATARFDRSVYGFHNAFKHFFGDHAKKVEPFEAFILIERLGNVQSHFLGKRIRQLMQRLIDEEELNLSDCENALKYYEGFIGHHFFLKDGDLTPNLVQERLKHDNRKALEPNNTLATQG